MKRFGLPVWLLFASTFQLTAQNNRPINPTKDKIEFQGYTVNLLPAMGGTYGYDILKDRALILHQPYNPFTMAPVGLRQKEDVYKIAKWQITHMNNRSRRALTNRTSDAAGMYGATVQDRPKAVLINQPLGKDLAKALNIDIH